MGKGGRWRDEEGWLEAAGNEAGELREPRGEAAAGRAGAKCEIRERKER